MMYYIQSRNAKRTYDKKEWIGQVVNQYAKEMKDFEDSETYESLPGKRIQRIKNALAGEYYSESDVLKGFSRIGENFAIMKEPDLDIHYEIVNDVQSGIGTVLKIYIHDNRKSIAEKFSGCLTFDVLKFHMPKWLVLTAMCLYSLICAICLNDFMVSANIQTDAVGIITIGAVVFLVRCVYVFSKVLSQENVAQKLILITLNDLMFIVFHKIQFPDAEAEMMCSIVPLCGIVTVLLLICIAEGIIPRNSGFWQKIYNMLLSAAKGTQITK